MIGLCKTFQIILAVWIYKQDFQFYCFEWVDLFFSTITPPFQINLIILFYNQFPSIF